MFQIQWKIIVSCLALFFYTNAIAGDVQQRHDHEIDTTGWGAELAPSPEGCIRKNQDQNCTRPKKAWPSSLNNSQIKIVVVMPDEQISTAIGRCGENDNKYCVVKILTSIELNKELNISRSKIKLLGVGYPVITVMKKLQDQAIVFVGEDVKEVVIEGLDLTGHDSDLHDLYGIQIHGKNINQVQISNNRIHDFKAKNAHAIIVQAKGANNEVGIKDVSINNNLVYRMCTGSSESIVINGNVSHWEIDNNTIDHVSNIAIDVIAGERKEAAVWRRPGPNDAARHGFVSNNKINTNYEKFPVEVDEKGVFSIFTANGSCKKNGDFAGIYVDGARHLKVYNNVVNHMPYGFEVGTENCVISRHILLGSNVADKSAKFDLLIGGYRKKGYLSSTKLAKRCTPPLDDDKPPHGSGYVRYITVCDNEFKSKFIPEDYFRNLRVSHRTTNTIIVDSHITKSVNVQNNGSADKDNNAYRITFPASKSCDAP